MVIKFICGMAGCSKSTTIINMITQFYNKGISFNCLAYTHSAVNNLRDMFCNTQLASSDSPTVKFQPLSQTKSSKVSSINSSKVLNQTQYHLFQTLHRFLKIPIEKDSTYKVIYHKDLKLGNYVIVDEYSLVPLDIFNYLFYLANTTSTTFIFVGDMIQLPPIVTSSDKPTKNNGVSYSNIYESEFKDIVVEFNVAVSIFNHLNQTIYYNNNYQKSDKLILTKNYRNDSNVFNILEKALDGEYQCIQQHELMNYVNKGYVVISSKYKYLKSIYQLVNHFDSVNQLFNTKIGMINILIGMKLVLITNIDNDYLNGDLVQVIQTKCSDNTIIVKHYDDSTNETAIEINAVNVLPYNYITCHKAQGKSIDNIILVLDEMFEITMLYTAITRARYDVKLICFDQSNKPKDYELKAFKLLRDVIYKSN